MPKKEEVFDLETFRKNLSYLRSNLRKAFGIKRRPLLRRFRGEDEEEESQPEVIVVERHAQAPQTREERLEKLRKGYVKESYSPYTEYTRTEPRTREEYEPEVEEHVEQPERPQFKGLGVRDFLRTLFEASSEQIRLRTELERLKLEKLKKKEEEAKRRKLKEWSPDIHLY